MSSEDDSVFSSALFRCEVVLPSIDDFALDPISLRKGLSAVWAIDAYVAHCAHEFNDMKGFNEDNLRDRDTTFCKHLRERSDYAQVYLSLLSAVSIAGKHGVKSGVSPVVRSLKNLDLSDEKGWSAFFTGQMIWGEQLCVTLSLTRCKETDRWVDSEGKPWPLLFFCRVTVMKIIVASMVVLDSWLEEATGEKPDQCFNIGVGDLKDRFRAIRGV